MAEYAYCSPPLEDLIDYPVSPAFWRDAYRQGLTPHRPPDLLGFQDDPEDVETLWAEVQELRERVQAQERIIARLVEAARSRPSQQPAVRPQRAAQSWPAQSSPLRNGRRIEIGEVEV